MLFFVKLLKVHEGVFVLRIEPEYFVECFERAIDEPAALVIPARDRAGRAHAPAA